MPPAPPDRVPHDQHQGHRHQRGELPMRWGRLVGLGWSGLHLVLLQAGYGLSYGLRRVKVVLGLKTVLVLGWQGRSRQSGGFRQRQFRQRGLRLDHDLGRFPGQLRLVDDSLPRIPAFLSIDDSPPPPRRRGALGCFTDDPHFF